MLKSISKNVVIALIVVLASFNLKAQTPSDSFILVPKKKQATLDESYTKAPIIEYNFIETTFSILLDKFIVKLVALVTFASSLN